MLRNQIENRRVAIFGGSGFIGYHLNKYLSEKDVITKIYNFDITPPRYTAQNINHIYVDVRQPIEIADLDAIDIVYNLAAIHRTPGHLPSEYLQTNILGAKNVCDFSRRHNVKTIIFFSSISPYAVSEDLKSEDTAPIPSGAYGISKLVAEYITMQWFLENPKDRDLIILRPGIVFGLHENGNFSRLFKAIKGKYFFYPGRKNTKKSCIYVKDLVASAQQMSIQCKGFNLYNMCYSHPPTIEEIVQTIISITGVSCSAPRIPGGALLLLAKIISIISKFVRIQTAIHPDRIRKLMYSTNISGKKLNESPFPLKHSLRAAVTDWFTDCDRGGLF